MKLSDRIKEQIEFLQNKNAELYNESHPLIAKLKKDLELRLDVENKIVFKEIPIEDSIPDFNSKNSVGMLIDDTISELESDNDIHRKMEKARKKIFDLRQERFDKIEYLRNLKIKLDNGSITEKEFESIKMQIVNLKNV